MKMRSIVITSACLSVCVRLSRKAHLRGSNPYEIFCRTTCYCSRILVFLRRQCNKLRTSGFVDDAIFHITGHKTWNLRIKCQSHLGECRLDWQHRQIKIANVLVRARHAIWPYRRVQWQLIVHRRRSLLAILDFLVLVSYSTRTLFNVTCGYVG